MKNLLFISLLACLLSSCSSSTLGAIVSDGSFKRITIGQKPPTKVTDTLELTNQSMFGVKFVAISPDGLHCVLVTKSVTNSSERVRIFNSLNGNKRYDWSEKNIRNMIENNSSTDYTDGDRFLIGSIRWKTEKSIILDIQPSIKHGGLNPAYASIVYNLVTKKVEEIGFYPREGIPRIQGGSFPNRNIYVSSINSNGELVIDGNAVQGVPGKVLFEDITTIIK